MIAITRITYQMFAYQMFDVLSLIVVLANIGDIIAYTDGLHSCKEVYPYRNQNKV